METAAEPRRQEPAAEQMPEPELLFPEIWELHRWAAELLRQELLLTQDMCSAWVYSLPVDIW